MCARHARQHIMAPRFLGHGLARELITSTLRHARLRELSERVSGEAPLWSVAHIFAMYGREPQPSGRWGGGWRCNYHRRWLNDHLRRRLAVHEKHPVDETQTPILIRARNTRGPRSFIDLSAYFPAFGAVSETCQTFTIFRGRYASRARRIRSHPAWNCANLEGL
jgi:hypothetical protein